MLVVVYRLPKKQNIVTGRSKCDFCKHKLAWTDLFPILSYILTKGKCKYCHRKISILYPAFELLTAAVFSLTYYFFPSSSIVSLTFYLVIVSALLAIFFIDLFNQIIPFIILLPAIAIVWLYNMIYSHSLVLNYTFAAFGAGIFIFFLFAITKGRGMGFGDVVFAFFMGSLVGFPRIIIALYISFVIGAITGVIYIIARKKHFRGTAIPFGPFLVLGTYMVMIMPLWMINTILNYFHLNYLLSML